MTMESVLKILLAEIEEFKEQSSKRVTKGNKTAGQRSRVISLSIEKHLKEWRKLSVENE